MRGNDLNHNHHADNRRISVIIPTINEIDNIEKALKSLRLGNTWEVIVADGGSSDGTVALAKTLGATVIEGSPPKSRQMNQGAASATGDVLLFLHADTRLPGKFDEHILKCLRRPGVVAGAFKLRLGSRKPALRIIEHLANWRSRWMKTPYGDQAIFISARLFHQIGGFPSIPIMEDFELVRQLRKRGGVVTLPVSVSTSARRWEKFGILKTTLLNQLIVLAHFVGVPLPIIAKWYHRKKET